ncbi:DUF4296 domain-containing protein [Parabacteroides bouchesdurhonensis]|uniref:DUF4296 domain-containing protein n=1 Tax=Parabacteroides bouchesdurhonensis TaxID=1936995 RepID=UPI000C82DCCB|nr:DUF4296 domain-containing protein [Parabacteroides bouchesdurhonensis]
MQNSLRRYGVLLLLTTVFAACSKVPDGVLSEKKMQQVVVDMQLAEAMIGTDYKKYPDQASKEALYQSVFRKHGISQALYDSSLIWYGKNLDIYMKVYDRVVRDLNKQITNLGDVQADAAPSSTRDSVDIWPRRPFMTLSPKAIFNGVVFDIRPEKDYSSGSIFVLGMNVWGINGQMKEYPEIRLSAVQGDTILTVNNKIVRDGYSETILETLPTRKVKRVYGYIRMNSTDSCYYKIYLDNISLMKYNYGTKVLEMKTDSIKK